MNRHQRRVAAKGSEPFLKLDLDEEAFHSRIEGGARPALLTIGLGDGMAAGRAWTSSVMEAGVVRKKFSPLFRLIVRLLLRPWILNRISQPESLWFLGVMAKRVGREPLGERLIERAIAIDPALAKRKHLAERPVGRTLAEWQALTQNSPVDASAWLGLGESLHAQGDDEGAMAACHRAVMLDPSLEEACTNLGAMLMQAGRFSDAEEVFRGYCRAAPESPRAFNNLGNVLLRQGRVEEARAALLKAKKLGPDLVEPVNNLGNVLSAQGRMDEAIKYYEQARRIAPALPEVLMNLGTAYQARGDFKSASDCYLEAIELRPTLAEAYLNLGCLLHGKQKFVEAEAAYRKGLVERPGFHPLLSALANLLQNVGEVEEAEALFRQTLAVKESAANKVEMALLTPVVYDSMDQAHAYRKRQADALADLEAEGLILEDPYKEISFTNFYIAYPGLDDRSLQEGLARFYLKTCPSLAWTAPHLVEGRKPAPRKRLRLGVLSAFLEPTHTIGKLFAGLLARLPRDRFEVIVFRFYHQSPNLTRSIDERVERVVRLPLRPSDQMRMIAAERLDVLFYPDIGMAFHTYFMAFSRLAPVQVVAWGHPDTTGIPNIDYFLSSEYLDPPGNEAHYSEKLVRLPLPPCCYELPKPGLDDLAGRAALGLPAGKRLYVCTQSLFKVHPEFRLALKRILERDPEGIVVFIKANPYLTKRLSRNLEAELGRDFKRVLFLAPLKHHEFLGLCACADALLDTFHFSGGNSSLEAFAYGCPIVTLPSQFMRGRVTAQFYKMMGIEELIARDTEHYVELALRLANDATWHAGIKERILGAKTVLFENEDAVGHFADFLEKATTGTWNG
ncbi:MAG: tetratricopeptide repeat protein [Alphaproteobacteria bacterium]|nr:tetratricopeptide repeat protein [Alphaproteobacteria bacterium]